ncbi:MAG: hypothetical protein LBV41_08520 [Cytophagaceae bacterium]|jgi:hypothetical protein|nr:hypothetical protein [Cytophagaceae bacterium]
METNQKSEKKIQINLPESLSKAEVVLREGTAVKELEPKAPVKTSLSGVIGVPFEYLKKRVETGQFIQQRSHLIVNREDIKLTLIINEDDDYLRGSVIGRLEFNSRFLDFGINTGKIWTPAELGLFFKMNRAFFPDKSANMKLVSDLMNFTATVNNRIDRSVKESGDRTDNFEQVVNSNLPASFTLNIPIFKGMNAETLEVETFAKVNGREVSFILLSPAVNQTLEDIRDKVIDEQLKEIIAVAPDIVIVEQ